MGQFTNVDVYRLSTYVRVKFKLQSSGLEDKHGDHNTTHHMFYHQLK